MTDQEQKIMAELKAACETCAKEIAGVLRLISTSTTTVASCIRLRAARHLARRAVGMPDEQLTVGETSDLRAIDAEGGP